MRWPLINLSSRLSRPHMSPRRLHSQEFAIVLFAKTLSLALSVAALRSTRSRSSFLLTQKGSWVASQSCMGRKSASWSSWLPLIQPIFLMHTSNTVPRNLAA